MTRKAFWAVLIILSGMIIFSGCTEKSSYSPERTIKDNVYLEGEQIGGIKESKALDKIRNLSAKLDRSPQDAVLDNETWEIKVKDKAGSRVSVEKTLNALLGAQKNENLKVVLENVDAGKKAEEIKANISEIASFATPILDNKAGRVNNIRLAAEYLDMTKLKPGEEFSFNGTLGKRTAEKGYQKAPIIINTKNGPKKSYGVGGGICQLSSTIYNAATQAGMRITERHSHSKPVGYVAKDMDATVVYESKDFRFVNTRQNPVMIRIRVTDDEIEVRLIENRNKA